MKKLATLILATVFIFQSCGDKTEKKSIRTTQKNIESDKVNNNDYTEENNHPKVDENNSQEPDIVYPNKGNEASDFVPNSGIYEIQNEATGDLNKDGLDDIAVVLRDKEDKTAERPMLILLQNKDKSYRLDKVSNFVMPIEYTDSDYKIYDTEDISIEKGILKILLYGTGPSGNLFSDFEYLDSDLILTHIETYNAGAGSWQQLYYDLKKSALTQIITNTMKEEMPTKEKTFKLTKATHKFENTSPDEIIMDAYKKIDSEW